MKLIRTHDGLLGTKFDTKLIWCDTVEEAVRIMYGHYGVYDHITRDSLEKDVVAAIDEMAKRGDTVAQFGVLGGFMYTKPEPDYEF